VIRKIKEFSVDSSCEREPKTRLFNSEADRVFGTKRVSTPDGKQKEAIPSISILQYNQRYFNQIPFLVVEISLNFEFLSRIRRNGENKVK
jgi:hypothetical protein